MAERHIQLDLVLKRPSSPSSDEDDASLASPRSVTDTESLKPIIPVESCRPSEFSSLAAEVAFIITILVSLMMSEYFTSGFNIILPNVSKSLSISPQDRTWPVSAPNLAAGALLLPASRLCGRYGSRVIFLTGHTWLFGWSVANGFSTGTIFTIMCRTMQGIGFAAFLPAGLSLLGQVYRPGPRKNKVYCLYGAFACIGFYFGIFTASSAIQFLSWRWYFWAGAVIEAIIVIAGFFAIPSGLKDHDHLVRMDWWGFVTIVPGVGFLVFAFSYGGHAPDGWKTPCILVAFVLCAALLSAAVYTQGWVSSNPLVPPRIFKPTYLKRILGVTLCCNGIWTLFLFYSSLYFNNVLHPSPTLAAAWYTPLAVGGIVLAIVGGLILHIVSSYILLLASGLGFLLCTLILSLIPLQPSDLAPSDSYKVYWSYVFPAMCSGTIGINIMLNVTNVFCTSAVSKKDQALIGGIINSLSYLGAAFWLGLSDAAISVTRSLKTEKLGEQEQYKIAFWMAAGLAIVALCLSSTARIGSASANTIKEEVVDEKGGDTRAS